MGDHQKDMLANRNQVYAEREIMDRPIHPIIVCLPKTTRANSPDDYRPLTLINAHIKMAWIISNHLRPCLADRVKQIRHCDVASNSFCDV